MDSNFPITYSNQKNEKVKTIPISQLNFSSNLLLTGIHNLIFIIILEIRLIMYCQAGIR